MGIVFLGPELSIRRFTPGLTGVISLRAHDVGRPISELTFRFDHEKIMALIEQALRSGKSTSGQIRKRDRVFLVNVILHVTAEATPGTHVRQLAVAFVDVSSQRKVSELLSANEALENYQLKSALTIAGQLENLQLAGARVPEKGEAQKSENENSAAMQGSIQVMLDQLRGMVSKWVEFSKLRRALPSLEILEVTTLVRKAAQEAGIPDSQLSLSNQTSFFGNRATLLQMFKALLTLSRERYVKRRDKQLSEGEQAMDPGFQVYVSARKDEGRIVFSYSDSGPTITESPYAEPFSFLTENTLTGQTELNTGLPFVARIIESHGGEWEVTEADREYGWSFGFSIPSDL